MSGIAAIFHRDGRPVQREKIALVASTLAMYGRDYQVFEMHGPVGLAYAHLTNVPEAVGEEQPVHGADSRFVLLFDGRLDNREELLGRLAIPESIGALLPDSALVMRLWEKWSTAAIPFLIGEFAIIVWDAKERKLHAFRDHLGWRALSYYEDPKTVVVASAPKGIFAATGIQREVDLQKLADVLADFYHDAGRSFFKNVHRLPPAHHLLADPTGLKLQRYWTLAPKPVRLASDDEYVEAASELLGTAVKARMRSVGKISAELSGGLDSSTVAVTALKYLEGQERLTTFTWIPLPEWRGQCPPKRYGDESPFVRAIAEMHPRLCPIFIDAADRGCDDRLDDFFRAAEIVPRAPIVCCYVHAIHDRARELGISAILTGASGNMTLSWDGLGVYAKWLRQGNLRRLLRELRLATNGPLGFLRKAVGRAILPLSPEWFSDAVWQIDLTMRETPTSGPRWRRFSAIEPKFAAEMAIESRAAKFGFNFFGASKVCDPDFRANVLTTDTALETGDFNQGLRALYGVECRDPLGDIRLVEWCLGIPEDQHLWEGQERRLVKRIMKGRLPDQVLHNCERGILMPDWHERMMRDLPEIEEQLAVLAEDPDTQRVIDVERVIEEFNDWPEQPDVSEKAYGGAFLMRAAPHAIASGRFVRWVKGANR
jgi:asparagine synthase (glutamine-hydrolysing)